ncbi:hypothetical protein RYX36_002676 [Vicia faba]
MESNHFSKYTGIYNNIHQPALIIAGCSVLVALVLSLFLIFQHLRSYSNPSEQKWIVSIVSMVPIYATESIISLWNPRLSLPCDILRSYYEAFALYAFGRYLIACLGGEGRVVELLEDESEENLEKPLLHDSDENIETKQRSFCNFFWRPCKLGKDVLAIEKFGLVQYMAIAAVAHVFVFSAKPYHFVPASSADGKVTEERMEAKLDIDEEGEKKPALFKETTTQVEAPRTSVTESVQDIVVEGGHRVVKDVVMTINQAIEPVEKGVTKIQKTFHHKTVVSSDEEGEKSDIEIETDVTESIRGKRNDIAMV